MGRESDTNPEIPSLRREDIERDTALDVNVHRGSPTEPPDAPEARPVRVSRGYPILEYFEYGHLPQHLQDFSRPFCELAYQMALELPGSAETAAGLRKLLEAKDCFVRAKLTAK